MLAKAWIYSVYSVDKTFKSTNITLELLVLERENQSLGVLISILVTMLLAVSWTLVCTLRLKRKDVFAKNLSGTIIWDKDKKERSSGDTHHSYSKIWKYWEYLFPWDFGISLLLSPLLLLSSSPWCIPSYFLSYPSSHSLGFPFKQHIDNIIIIQ